ncbi:MAG: ABC transporter ATP-binding protein [Spirochaetia bacterium]
MIEASQLTKTYGTVEAVRNVSFEIGTGEIVGLLGPNGAGKTSIMRILTAFHYPSSGTAVLDGHDVVDEPLQVKQAVGYLPENAPVYTELNVAEYLEFIVSSRNIDKGIRKDRINWVIRECGLAPVLYRGIDKLSKGFKQRVGLAQAIIHDPKILILDEPTTGLDPNQIIEIRRLIRKLGQEKTVILSTHILQEVEAVCDRVLILNEGTIVAQGTPEAIGSELKGEDIYTLLLKCGEQELLQKLPSLKAVKKIIRTEPAGTGKMEVELSAPPDPGNGEAIFDWAVDSGFKILAMTPRRYSLEDIFIRLTARRTDEQGGEDE